MKTRVIKIDPENIDLEKIKKAAGVIKKGGIVAFPTETVYGLAADFLNKRAVHRIFKLKKRPQNKPLTVQIEDITYLERLGCDVSTFSWQLMSKFWPGPLTLVLPLHRNLGVGGKAKGTATIGVRIPANRIARSLIKMSHTPIVAPSANLSGEPAAKTAQEVIDSFDGLIDVVIDSGAVELGVASTVVDLSVSPFRILREGIISRKEIQDARG
ncbi:threonylcarbamoyl-AMP synthase [bacterium]|nr:threonylcarbamoyl-AMP synthase [bacterium]